MRLLYIDDDRINTLLFVEACRFADGVEVESAASGAEALELVQRWRPDLLVVDLHLPDTNGYELLGALRQRLEAPTLPAFLCTAEEADLVAEPARQAGFEGCWIKPVDLATVLAELSRRSAQAGPAA
jgi:two-component system, OmpR family, response regulator